MRYSNVDNMLFIDSLSEKGHQNFNLNFIKLFDVKDKTLYCSDEHEVGGIGKTVTFKSSLLEKSSVLLYRIKQLLILLKSLPTIKNSQASCVVFLSYELISFSLFSHLLAILIPSKRIYVVEHNTFVPSNRIKFKIFTSISKKVKHICLAEYIEECIISLGRQAIYITHPFELNAFGSQKSLSNSSDFMNESFGFMPSSNIDKKTLEVVKGIFKNSKLDISLIYKDAKNSISGRLISQKYFENYEELLRCSKVVFIPQKFEYRVSGVFFEAIANSNAIIVMSRCKYSLAMKSIFENGILIIEDLEHSDDVLNDILSYKLDLSRRSFVVNNMINKSKENIAREFYGKD